MPKNTKSIRIQSLFDSLDSFKQIADFRCFPGECQNHLRRTQTNHWNRTVQQFANGLHRLVDNGRHAVKGRGDNPPALCPQTFCKGRLFQPAGQCRSSDPDGFADTFLRFANRQQRDGPGLFRRYLIGNCTVLIHFAPSYASPARL